MLTTLYHLESKREIKVFINPENVYAIVFGNVGFYTMPEPDLTRAEVFLKSPIVLDHAGRYDPMLVSYWSIFVIPVEDAEALMKLMTKA